MSLFFALLRSLIGWRLGRKSYYHAKVGSFRDSIRVSVIVCKICNLRILHELSYYIFCYNNIEYTWEIGGTFMVELNKE